MSTILIAGAFTATWNGTNIGATREGFRIREIFHTQQVICDAYGEVPINGVQQGVEVSVSLDSIEYDLIKPAIIAAYGTQGAGKAKVGFVMSGLAKVLVLTPVAGTPAATSVSGWTAEATYTFHKAIIEGDVETILSSKLRQGPVTFRCYPDPGTTPANKTYTLA